MAGLGLLVAAIHVQFAARAPCQLAGLDQIWGYLSQYLPHNPAVSTLTIASVSSFKTGFGLSSSLTSPGPWNTIAFMAVGRVLVSLLGCGCFYEKVNAKIGGNHGPCSCSCVVLFVAGALEALVLLLEKLWSSGYRRPPLFRVPHSDFPKLESRPHAEDPHRRSPRWGKEGMRRFRGFSAQRIRSTPSLPQGSATSWSAQQPGYRFCGCLETSPALPSRSQKNK